MWSISPGSAVADVQTATLWKHTCFVLARSGKKHLEPAVWKGEFIRHSPRKREHAGPLREASGSVRRPRERRRCGFCRNEWLWLDSVSNFRRLRAVGVLSACRVLAPGGVQQRKSWLVYESAVKEVVGSVGSGSVGLHIKGELAEEWFTVFRN